MPTRGLPQASFRFVTSYDGLGRVVRNGAYVCLSLGSDRLSRSKPCACGLSSLAILAILAAQRTNRSCRWRPSEIASRCWLLAELNRISEA